ncbi:MAG: ABC transporter permease subunit [Clostridiales bacterium]|nr:ABC transporter permease subunit [Clostridiales bacterium]
MKRKKTGTCDLTRICLVLLVALALCLPAAVAVRVYSFQRTGIFEMVEFGTNFQNNKILVESDITYLGTYQNTILAFDKSGGDVWSYGISGAIGAMEYDTDRNWLIVGSQDRNIYIFDGTQGELLAKYPAQGKVYDLDYDPAAGQLLVSCSMNDSKHFLSTMDIETGETLLNVKIKQVARSARFSPDYRYFYYGDSRGRVYKLDRNGETVVSGKAQTEVRSLAVSHPTGEVYALDVKGNLFKYDENLNQIFSVSLVGEGRTVGVSDDGKWVAAGTREGDVYILDSDGAVHFTARQTYDISQVYFGEDVSYVVTLSPELFRFSTARLDNIGLMTALSQWSLLVAIVLAILLAADLIALFPRSRMLAIRCFRTFYKYRVAYLMLLPSIVLILIFNYYNIFQAFYYAFTDWSQATKTMREVNFIGFDNFVKMVTEGYFLLGVKNLLIMMACSFLKLLTIPLLLSELVFSMRNRHGESSRRRYCFRLLLVAPMVVPGVVNTLMWKNIYDPNIGALNSILDTIGLSSWKHSWLGDPQTALGAIICMGFPWVNSFAFLVYYGGLINIPQDLFEAAKVDGSTPAWNFIHIHLPLISPQLKMLIITTFINSVQDYGHVYLLTQGGPGTATYVPGLELYFAATKFGQYGYACAMGLVMFIVILAGSLFNLRMKTHELN